MSEHSPLGASGAHRWMNCAGSVGLLKLFGMPESEEEDYTKVGTALHEAAALALNEDLQAWELTGMQFGEVEITSELAIALPEYLEHCRALHAATGTYGVEFRISSPVHELFYGTADDWAIAPSGIFPGHEGDYRMGSNALHITDLKGGIGVLVEVEENPQEMYYAFGVIDTLERQRSYVFDDDMPVVLHICQPRGFHPDGILRSWQTTVGHIKRWTHEVLVPAMVNTALDHTLAAGDWCRFCPAKLVCPMLQSLFKTAAASTNAPIELGGLTNEQLGYNYRFIDPVKFFVASLQKEAQRRLTRGETLPWEAGRNLKLVYMKSNRVWKDGAAELAIRKFGAAALDLPEWMWKGGNFDADWWLENAPKIVEMIKTPAGLEKIPEAREWVKSFAYQPKGALTVAPPDDPRHAIEVQRLSERFEGVLDLQEETT